MSYQRGCIISRCSYRIPDRYRNNKGSLIYHAWCTLEVVLCIEDAGGVGKVPYGRVHAPQSDVAWFMAGTWMAQTPVS